MKNKKSKQQVLLNLVMTALFAALIMVMTAYLFHIPTGINDGYLHFGDALIYLAACFLPTPYAALAAAIGGGMADLVSGVPIWIVPTMLIKALISLPYSCKSDKIVTGRHILMTVLSGVISIGGYFVAERLLFGSWAAAALSLPASLIQSSGSAVIFLIIGFAMDRVQLKNRLQILYRVKGA